MFQPNQPFPFRCKDYQDYINVVQIIDRLNALNANAPIKYSLVSGSPDSEYPGARYLDLVCASPGKLSHLFEEIETSDRFKRYQQKESKPQKAVPNPLYPLKGSLFGPGEIPALDKNSLAKDLDNLPIQSVSFYKINPKTGIPEKADTEEFLDDLKKYVDKELFNYYLNNFGNGKDFKNGDM